MSHSCRTRSRYHGNGSSDYYDNGSSDYHGNGSSDYHGNGSSDYHGNDYQRRHGCQGVCADLCGPSALLHTEPLRGTLLTPPGQRR
ncbi:hypothetical protein CRUP_002475 [Coryphaenoides rupestris]|nr:hypothetical protein CRUP_002475 [Coryphaenoides rupestris]